MPGALHLEWSDLLDKDTQRFKPADELRAASMAHPATTVLAFITRGRRVKILGRPATTGYRIAIPLA